MTDLMHELEVKVAFLEETVIKLSDEYYAQQKELLTLKQQVQALADKLKDTQNSDNSAPEILDERPPHY